MSKATRERAALVIFFVLILMGAFILMSYFSTGRGWSVAATAVDDSVGQLEDYTVIVYSGVAEPDPLAQEGASIQDKEITEADREMGLGFELLNLTQEVEGLDAGRVFVSDVRELYETRGADVLSLDLSHGGRRYAIPQIFDVDGKKIGVFSLDRRLPADELDAITDDLRERGAASILCITPRPALISSYDGIDVVIFTTGTHAYSVTNDPEDQTMVTNSPERGNVGVILLSSNNVPSAKSVDSL